MFPKIEELIRRPVIQLSPSIAASLAQHLVRANQGAEPETDSARDCTKRQPYFHAFARFLGVMSVFNATRCFFLKLDQVNPGFLVRLVIDSLPMHDIIDIALAHMFVALSLAPANDKWHRGAVDDT